MTDSKEKFYQETAEKIENAILKAMMRSTPLDYRDNIRSEEPTALLLPIFLPAKVIEALEYLLKGPDPIPKCIHGYCSELLLEGLTEAIISKFKEKLFTKLVISKEDLKCAT